MIHLFFTGGSGNRGCEAIVRGTKEILTNQVKYGSALYNWQMPTNYYII